jgi:hypothetical protein
MVISQSSAGEGRGGEILTVNEEYKVGHPYASCDRNDQLIPVPNGGANGAYERMPMAQGR